MKEIRLIHVPIAPINQQHRIVAKIEELFSDLDAGVEALKKAKAQLKLYRQAVLKAAFEGRLTAAWREAHKGELEPATTVLEKESVKTKKKIGPTPDVKELDSELPELWISINLGYCAELITKGESPKWQGFDYVKEGIPFIRSENVLWGKVNLSNPVNIPETFHRKLKRSQLSGGDVLINLVGASIGRCGLLPLSFGEGNINQAVALIRVKNVLLPAYLMYLLNSPKIQKEIHGSKVETARPNISLADLNELVIPLPPIPEQEQIVNEIERYYTLADHVENDMENNIRQGERLRQSILKKAFMGELVPQDPADEPAAVLLERIKRDKAAQPAGKKPGRRAARKKPAKLW
jgi:restriction endonuclease S subunit